MKRILTLALALIALGTLNAQSVPGSVTRTSPVEGAGNGKISGVVIDVSNDQPVEFATVALMNPTTNKPVDGTVCDDKGRFTINKIEDGVYKVVISFIGYESQSFDVTISDKDHNIDLGTIKLGSTAQILNEVTVEGQKALIEERVDRTVYNAENDMTTRGGDATDVLRRVPLLSVDLDGNVSLRGNGNIRVLINNKPSTIAASSVADALKQIPADQIKSVEVITSPSAKYDAEGSAGIINIITKKNTLQGVTLNINSGFGYRGSNLGLNGNYRNKKMGFSLGGFGRASYNVNGAFTNTQISKANLSSSVQQAETRNNNMFGRYTLGWDYDINKNNYIVASARFGVRNGNSFQDDFMTMQYDQNGVLQSSSLAEIETKDNSGTLDLNIDYTHTYEKPGKELSFSTQYSRNNRVNNFWNIGYDPADVSTILMRRKNENDSYNEETTLQVDYQSPIGKTQMIEMGAKGIMRVVSSDYASFTANGANGSYVVVPSASNIFNYNQNITAGYLSYTIAAKSYAVKAGTRYEYTTINANFEEQEGNPDPEIPSYGVLVPSINVSKRLSNNNMIKAAYNRRIQRPSIQFLNPNRQNSNVLFQTIGNPNLDPEFTNNYEVSYSTFIKGTSINFSVFYRTTNDAIQSVRTLSGDTIFTNYANIGQEDAYGINVFANVTIGKLMLNGGADVYYASLSNGDENDIQYRASNTGWVASGRMFGNYNLNKGWGIQFFGYFRGRQVLLQGTSGGFGMYSVGLKKDINDRKGSIGFAAENFFTNGIKIRTETNSSSLIQSSVNELRNMNFRITFSYRIGKMSFDQPRRRSKGISNDDLKEGGGGDMGGGFDMQPSSPSRGGQMPGNVQPQAPVVEMAKSENDSVIFEIPGTWAYTVETQQGSNGGTIALAKDGDVYSGSIKSTRGETPFKSVEVEGNNLTMIYTLSFNGNEVEVKIQAVIDQDEMKGVMNFGQFRSVPFTAKREAKN